MHVVCLICCLTWLVRWQLDFVAGGLGLLALSWCCGNLGLMVVFFAIAGFGLVCLSGLVIALVLWFGRLCCWVCGCGCGCWLVVYGVGCVVCW